MLGENLNCWLSDRQKQGHLVLRNKELKTDLPGFVIFLQRECVSLDLQYNDFELIGESLGMMESLRELNLSHNNLRGEECLPASLSSLKRLQSVSVADNQLEQIPLSVCGLGASLERLEVQDNLLDHLPHQLGALTGLLSLNASYNNISHLPECLTTLSHLSMLLLDGNVLLDPLPASLPALVHLCHLSLQSTGLVCYPSKCLTPDMPFRLSFLQSSSNFPL